MQNIEILGMLTIEKLITTIEPKHYKIVPED